MRLNQFQAGVISGLTPKTLIQPKFNGGLVVKGFENDTYNANDDVAMVIVKNHDRGAHLNEVNVGRYVSQGEAFVFNGETVWLASSITKAKNAIYKIAREKLGWDVEKTDKVIHKLYERLAGIDNLDFNEI